MKKTAVSLMSVLLASLVVEVQFASVAKANPYRELGNVPPDSATKPSRVTIFSPMNDTTYTTTTPLTLSVNVTLPESSTAMGTILYFVICKTDWQENETYLYFNDGSDSIESQSFHHYFQGSRDFSDIPDGNHSIEITAIPGGWYPGDCGFYRFMINGSSTVFFASGVQPTSTETPIPTAEPFSTTLLIGSAIAVVAVLGVGLLVYFKKHKR
jgi:hypothetical protein